MDLDHRASGRNAGKSSQKTGLQVESPGNGATLTLEASQSDLSSSLSGRCGPVNFKP